MKKTYLQPSTVMVMTQVATIVCGSEGVSSDKGIDYGGVDEDGELDPASRKYRRHDVWEDEELEEEEYEDC